LRDTRLEADDRQLKCPRPRFELGQDQVTDLRAAIFRQHKHPLELGILSPVIDERPAPDGAGADPRGEEGDVGLPQDINRQKMIAFRWIESDQEFVELFDELPHLRKGRIILANSDLVHNVFHLLIGRTRAQDASGLSGPTSLAFLRPTNIRPQRFFGGELKQRVRISRAPFARLVLALLLATTGGSVLGETKEEAQVRAEHARRMIPTSIAGTYQTGNLIEHQVHGRKAYVLKPTGRIDPQKRWAWTFPFWLAVNDGFGNVQHRFYVEKLLAAGFHVAGIDVGTSCGSPSAAAVCHEFYQFLVEHYELAPRARLIGQSNGGLIAYAWAFRHPQCVDRIAGILPATDFRTWPGLANLTTFPERGLEYGLTLPQLQARVADFNPIDNLRPLAASGVKILHLHGDHDDVVPIAANSLELADRYRKLGGSTKAIVLKGLRHGGTEFYESQPFIEFVLAE
jgi:predicted esterase